jgi:hypothetical protein
MNLQADKRAAHERGDDGGDDVDTVWLLRCGPRARGRRADLDAKLDAIAVRPTSAGTTGGMTSTPYGCSGAAHERGDDGSVNFYCHL